MIQKTFDDVPKADISSFANTSDGYLIYGIKAAVDKNGNWNPS